MNIQPVFNQYKAMVYMCPEDQWSEFTEEAAKKAFMDYVHHYERMETISRSDLGKSKCNQFIASYQNLSWEGFFQQIILIT